MREPTGQWVLRQRPTDIHECEPPLDEPGYGRRQPVGVEGDLWRCGCGRLWCVIERLDHVDRALGRIYCRYWRPATLWQRWRHRTAGFEQDGGQADER